MDDTDPVPDARTNIVLVPLIRASALGELESSRTLWFLAGEGNEKARRALRDGPDDG